MEVYCDDFDVWDFIPFSFAIAQTEIDSSVTSILNSLTPLNTLVLGALVLALVLKKTGLGCFNWTFGKLTFSF
jgi:ABC-type tungstate transport system substrate-binding protein